MKHVEPLMFACLVLAAAPAVGQVSGPPKQPKSTAGAPEARSASPDRGQHVFAQNCARCHNAPEGFSSHISGTIAKHMRVRASLSAEDYKALLRFLNP